MTIRTKLVFLFVLLSALPLAVLSAAIAINNQYGVVLSEANLAVMSAVLLLLVGLIALAIAKLLTDPLRRLQNAAEQLAAGDLAARLQVDSTDEAGRLAASFNQMAANLQVLYGKLEEKVQEKTQELAQRYQALHETQTTLLSVLEDLEQSNSQLEAEKALAQATLSSIGDGVFAIDSAGTIRIFNSAAEQISGFAAAEAIGRNYRDILRFAAEGSIGLNDTFIQTALQGERAAMSSRTTMVRKNMEEIAVADSASPIRDRENRVIGAVVVFRDVSHELELERMKDEFMAVASHELHTPMTAIKGLIAMISEGDFGEVPAGLSAPLNDMAASTQRLIQLVDDLLNMSRIETGHLSLRLEDMPLQPVVADMVANLQSAAKKSALLLSIEGKTDAVVRADPHKVRQILGNILANSLKFTKQGGVTIYFREGPQRVSIYVRDTGEGISEADQSRLFRKFEQISSQEQGRPAGTGLGLYISRRLAQKMGGDLWLESSSPGFGSVFAFSLPKVGVITKTSN